MTAAEIEKVQGEVSASKVEIENGGGGGESRHDVGSDTDNQDLVNGKSDHHGLGNGNGDITVNGAVADDHLAADGDFIRPVGSKEVEEVQGENGSAVGEEKIGNGRIEDSSVSEAAGEQNVGGLEPEKADDGSNVGDEARGSKNECELPSPAENGEVNKVESEGKVGESLDTRDPSGDLPDPGLEPANGERVEEKSKFDCDRELEENQAEEKHPNDSDQSVESVNRPLGDNEVGVEHSVHPDSGSAVDFLSETDTVRVLVSNGNGDIQLEARTVVPSASDNDVPSESEALKISASVENGDVPLESEGENVPSLIENGDVPLESEGENVPSLIENGDVPFESEGENVPSLIENGVVGSKSEEQKLSANRSESGPVKVRTAEESGDIIAEPRAIQVPGSDEKGAAQSDSGAVKVPAFNEKDDAPAESVTTKVPDSDENGNNLSELAVGEDPASKENSDTGSESRAASVSSPDENGKVESDAERVDVSASSQDGKVHMESEATSIPTINQDGGSRLESKAVNAPSSNENGNDLVAYPVVNGLSDANQQTPEKCETGPVEKDTRVDSGTENVTQVSPLDELDMCQSRKAEPDVKSVPEVTHLKQESSLTAHDSEGTVESKFGIDADACQNIAEAEEVKSLPPKSFDVNVPSDSTEICLAPGSDSDAEASKLAENSADDVADAARTDFEVVQSDEACGEPVNLPTENGSKVETKVKDGPTENSVVTIVEGVSENIPSENVCDPAEASNLKENSEAGAADGVGTENKVTESEHAVDSPLANNGKVDLEVKDKLENNDNYSSGTSACLRSTTETSASDGKSDSYPAETEVETDVENENHLSTSLGEKETIEADVKSALSYSADAIGVVSSKVQSVGEDNDEKLGGEISQKDETLISAREGPVKDEASDGNNMAAETERQPFYFLPRVPRYDDEKLAEQIRHAQLQVDKKTQARDTIGAEIREIRVSCKEYGSGFDVALTDERSARDALRSKRQEIDSLQSVINRVKSVMSIDDIDARVHNMEHTIQHETVPLKVEKQLIREIKQLKQLRGQISSNMGTQDEIQQALDEKDQNEERLKVLRKELDKLRDDLLKAESVTKAARKKYHDESDKLNHLQDQFKAADAVRQEAYAHLQSLRKESREKNKHFFKYRDDSRAANELALKKDKEALQSFCLNQVESFMKVWNEDNEFRKDYVRCNTRSTLRRLGTPDGRSLGPDEEPPAIPRAISERVDKLKPEKHDATLIISKQQEQVVPLEDAKVEDKPATMALEQKMQSTKHKKPVKSVPPTSLLPTVSGKEEIEESKKEEPKISKQEEDSMRKAEELRKQEEAAKLKEQRRLEEIAKAKEALERKKRKEEKAKARAALRAQKEAEEKEKEKEKRLKKKEKRKAIGGDDTNTTSEEQTALSLEAQTETPREVVTQEKQLAAQPKRPHKPSQFAKQSKLKPIPPPLRNRSKRKMQQWMWIALISLLVFALFILGNGNFSFNSLRVLGFY